MVAYTTVVIWLARVHFIARKAVEGVEELAENVADRLEKAQESHEVLIRLTAAVDHLADKFAAEMKHLAVRQDEARAHTEQQLNELKNEVREILRSGQRANGGGG
ncbi:MAG: hypothetical protein WDA06_06585 [Phenylobacterium sp.]